MHLMHPNYYQITIIYMKVCMEVCMKDHIACMKVHIVGTNLESFRRFAVNFLREKFALNFAFKAYVCRLHWRCRSHCIKLCTEIHSKSLSLQVALMFAGYIENCYFWHKISSIGVGDQIPSPTLKPYSKYAIKAVSIDTDSRYQYCTTNRLRTPTRHVITSRPYRVLDNIMIVYCRSDLLPTSAYWPLA